MQGFMKVCVRSLTAGSVVIDSYASFNTSLVNTTSLASLIAIGISNQSNVSSSFQVLPSSISVSYGKWNERNLSFLFSLLIFFSSINLASVGSVNFSSKNTLIGISILQMLALKYF